MNDLGCGPLDATSAIESGVAEAVAAEIRERGGDAIASDGDVTADAEAIVAAAVDRWCRVDALVNNAGIVGAGYFPTRDPAMFEATFRVHALGTVNMTRAAWPHLADVGGRVVNTTSGAVVGLPEQTAYTTAKGAVFGFTRSAALDGRPHGIRVNAIMPVAETRMWGATQHDYDETEVTDTAALHAALQPAAVSPLVAWLARESVPCTGQVFEAAGGYASRLSLAFGPAVAGGAPEDYAAQYGPWPTPMPSPCPPISMTSSAPGSLRSSRRRARRRPPAEAGTARFALTRVRAPRTRQAARGSRRRSGARTSP